MSNRVRRPKPSPLQQATQRQRGHHEADPASRRRTVVIVAGLVAAAVVVVGGAALIWSRSSSTSSVQASPEAIEYGCVSCHTTSGNRSQGPTWKGLAGSTVALTDGRTVTADDAYLRRSITEPQAEIVAGYDGMIMPFRPIPPADLDRLVKFIQSIDG